jgi:hypothetical protein
MDLLALDDGCRDDARIHRRLLRMPDGTYACPSIITRVVVAGGTLRQVAQVGKD